MDYYLKITASENMPFLHVFLSAAFATRMTSSLQIIDSFEFSENSHSINV